MSEIIGCPDCNPFDALINSVSQITGVVKRCGALILEMTNSVQIFHLGCQTSVKINVDVFVGRLQFIIQPIKLIVDHLYGLKRQVRDSTVSAVCGFLGVNRLRSPTSCRASAIDRRGTV